MRISDWSSDVCSSDLIVALIAVRLGFTWAYHDPLFAVIEATLATICVGTLVRAAPSFMEARPLVRLGDVSYSVYILHFPILAGLALMIDELPLDRNALAPPLPRPNCVTDLWSVEESKSDRTSTRLNSSH